jgi:UPF0271 protein
VKKTLIDLNSDMGEGFGPWTIGDGVDEELMPLISSANIATGFHAGDPNIMRRMVALARRHGVGIGAHPGFRDLVGFGRRHIHAPADELVNDMVYQLGALREFARLEGMQLQHIKPHGALYMHAARDEALSRALVTALRQIEPTLRLFCMEVSVTYRVARELGQPVVREFYADRDYDLSGAIVFTRRVGALDPECGRGQGGARLHRGRRAHGRRRGRGHRLRLGLHPQRHARRPGAGANDPGRAGRARHSRGGPCSAEAEPFPFLFPILFPYLLFQECTDVRYP